MAIVLPRAHSGIYILTDDLFILFKIPPDEEASSLPVKECKIETDASH
jgi:hypothetical protein